MTTVFKAIVTTGIGGRSLLVDFRQSASRFVDAGLTCRPLIGKRFHLKRQSLDPLGLGSHLRIQLLHGIASGRFGRPSSGDVSFRNGKARAQFTDLDASGFDGLDGLGPFDLEGSKPVRLGAERGRDAQALFIRGKVVSQRGESFCQVTDLRLAFLLDRFRIRREMFSPGKLLFRLS